MSGSIQFDVAARSGSGFALIFDMDGVVLDSNPVHRAAWTEYGRRFGLEVTGEMFERMYGKRNDDIVWDYFGADLPPEEVAARGADKERLYREMIRGRVEGMLTRGLREFLDRHSALPMALASNAEPENIEAVIGETGLARYFRAIVDGHQVSRPKPFPDVFLLAAARLGTEPRRCIVFEDSHAGVAAARAAGMKVAGINSTHRDLPGADIVISDFLSEELEPWLNLQLRAA